MGPSQASSSGRLNYTGTRLLLYTRNKENPFFCCPKISSPKCRYSAFWHFRSPKRRSRTTIKI